MRVWLASVRQVRQSVGCSGSGGIYHTLQSAIFPVHHQIHTASNRNSPHPNDAARIAETQVNGLSVVIRVSARVARISVQLKMPLIMISRVIQRPFFRL